MNIKREDIRSYRIAKNDDGTYAIEIATPYCVLYFPVTNITMVNDAVPCISEIDVFGENGNVMFTSSIND